MKIKHWAGYGTVNAECIRGHIGKGSYRKIIEVTGDHEQGLVRNDAYDIERWLLRKFVRGKVKLDDYGIFVHSDTRVQYVLIYHKEEQ